MNTEELIKAADLGNRQKWDMTADEMQYIKESNENKLGHIDILDLMYDAYKLGFSKGILFEANRREKIGNDD